MQIYAKGAKGDGSVWHFCSNIKKTVKVNTLTVSKNSEKGPNGTVPFGTLFTPLLLSLADVALVTELGHTLCLGKELFGLIGICLLD